MTGARLTSGERLERRKERRLNEILDGAAALFSQFGYESTTADAIASAVHLTKSALYTYVGSKEEIAVRLLERVILQLLGEAEAIAAREIQPRARIAELVVRHVVVVGNHRASSLLFWHSEHILSAKTYPELYASRDRYERYLRDWIQSGIDDGIFKVKDAKLAGFMVLGSLNWVIRWFSRSGPLRIETIGSHYAAMLLGALQEPDFEGSHLYVDPIQ